ncbi:MAG: helix-turn-helix transcriptional regulator [Clostridiales bacterium]
MEKIPCNNNENCSEKEKSNDNQLEFMKRIADAIAQLFGCSCETLVSNNDDPNHSILHINNGHVTNRKIGSPVSGLGLKKIRSGDYNKDMVNYIIHTENGRIIKCASIYYTDEEKSYSLGINFDYTEIANAIHCLEGLTNTNQEMEDEFSSNPNKILSDMFKQAIKTINKPLNQFNRDDKIKVVKALDEMGAFLLHKGVSIIAQKLDISRYTVYNYIKAISKEEK